VRSHAGVGQPAFGAGPPVGPASASRALRQLAHDDVGDLARIGEGPGQVADPPPSVRPPLGDSAPKAAGTVPPPGRVRPMLDSEQVDGGAVKIGVGHDRMGRTEVDADQITGRARSSDGSALPAQGGLGAGIFMIRPISLAAGMSIVNMAIQIAILEFNMVSIAEARNQLTAIIHQVRRVNQPPFADGANR